MNSGLFGNTPSKSSSTPHRLSFCSSLVWIDFDSFIHSFIRNQIANLRSIDVHQHHSDLEDTRNRFVTLLFIQDFDHFPAIFQPLKVHQRYFRFRLNHKENEPIEKCRLPNRCDKCWTNWWAQPEKVSRASIKVKIIQLAFSVCQNDKMSKRGDVFQVQFVCFLRFWPFTTFVSFFTGESQRSRFHFTDSRVCKSFLLDCCPHDIFASTVCVWSIFFLVNHMLFVWSNQLFFGREWIWANVIWSMIWPWGLITKRLPKNENTDLKWT